MRRCFRFIVVAWSFAVVGALFVAESPAAGETNAPVSAAVLTNAVLQKVEYPKSEFVIEPTFGRDPFYPASTRRTAVAEPVVPTTPEVTPDITPTGPPKEMVNTLDPSLAGRAEAPDNELAFLSVKGIIATTSRRVITLHTTVRSYIFRTGDSMTVRVPDGRMRVRCLEIRGRSGVFQVEGRTEPVELHLREE